MEIKQDWNSHACSKYVFNYALSAYEAWSNKNLERIQTGGVVPTYNYHTSYRLRDKKKVTDH